MSKFIHIPDQYEPFIKSHHDYRPVYRAVENVTTLDYTDFLPSIIENQDSSSNFDGVINDKDQPLNKYSTSVFTDIDMLKKKIEQVPILKKKKKAIAEGFTTNSRGVSTKKKDGHVNYYLYDYMNNSPKDDFKICEELV